MVNQVKSMAGQQGKKTTDKQTQERRGGKEERGIARIKHLGEAKTQQRLGH